MLLVFLVLVTSVGTPAASRSPRVLHHLGFLVQVRLRVASSVSAAAIFASLARLSGAFPAPHRGLEGRNLFDLLERLLELDALLCGQSLSLVFRRKDGPEFLRVIFPKIFSSSGVSFSSSTCSGVAGISPPRGLGRE